MLPERPLAVVYHLAGSAHCFLARGIEIGEIDAFVIGVEFTVVDVEMKNGHAASLVEQQNNVRSIALFRSGCDLTHE